MTRIIAGAVGGRTIQTPRGRETRPTTDRVREALFSRVEALLELDGARVLDLFAGSGALGLEALSRGAAHLLAVEKHRPTARLIEQNARALGLGARTEVRSGPVETVLAAGPGDGSTTAGEGAHLERTPDPHQAYDLVLLDPPYPLGEQALSAVLQDLLGHGWLGADALVVLERSSRSPRPTWPDGLRHLDTRTYGETALHLAEPGRPRAAG